MKFKLFLLILLCSKIHLTFAQINNEGLEQSIQISDSNESKVMLALETQNFFKNNEYFHDISTGYTLMGTQWKTSIAYQISPYIRIQGGVFLQQDFGHNPFHLVQPIFSLKASKHGYSMLFGSLESNLSHKLLDPILSYERNILTPIENGIQLKVDRKNIWSDTWMNWEKMQYLGDSSQEKFTVGHSSQIHVLKKKSFSVDFPIQFLVTHRGGQIDIDTTALQTIMNFAAGFKLRKMCKGFIKEIQTENYALWYKDFSPTKRWPYGEGNAFFLNATIRTKFDISASLGYWQGFQYLASRGGYLFQSAAFEYGTKGYTESSRKLCFIRLLYQHQLLQHLYADVRFEPYIDLGKQFFEYSYSFYLTYKNDFNLINLKKSKKVF
ncbi:MAG: hypothetical protein KA198_03020 [Chitinophagaceae bacterium]|nr:hypothetical protein [Chitinophagaceae bacterium]